MLTTAYTTDDGVTWINLSTVSGAASDISRAARVLSGASGGRVRFVSNAGFAGTAEIRFHLWNGEGYYWNGGMADVTTRDESGDISQGFVTASVTVEPGEDWICEIFGTVTDEAGVPVADAEVALSSETAPCLRNGLSSEDGRFWFEMLPRPMITRFPCPARTGPAWEMLGRRRSA